MKILNSKIMKPTTQLLALFAIAILAFSCKKTTKKATSSPDVYVSGYINDTLNI